MSQPPAYNRTHQFLEPDSAQSEHPLRQGRRSMPSTTPSRPRSTLILVDLALIQNDDTTLANQSVGPAQRSRRSSSLPGFTAPSARG